MVNEVCENVKEEVSGQALSPRSGKTTPCSKCSTENSAVKKHQQVVVTGGSLLKGTEAPTCRPDLLYREICCLPWARIRGVTCNLTNSVEPLDYYSLLIFHVGTTDVAARSLRSIKRDFKALGR